MRYLNSHHVPAESRALLGAVPAAASSFVYFLIERSERIPQLAHHVWSNWSRAEQIKTHSFTETIDRGHKKNNTKCIAFFRSRAVVGGCEGVGPLVPPASRVLNAPGKCFSGGRMTERRQRRPHYLGISFESHSWRLEGCHCCVDTSSIFIISRVYLSTDWIVVKMFTMLLRKNESN